MHKRTWLGGATITLAIAAGGLGVTLPARAADETCVQCKHADCLRGTIARKGAMANGYDALAARYGVGWKNADGTAAMEWDMSTFRSELERAQGYDTMREQQTALSRDEEALSERAGPPAGCETGDAEDPSTNTETCVTTGLVAAMAQSPCKQIGDLLARHEGVHQASCEVRKRTPRLRLIDPLTQRYVRDIPTRMITPAGRAAEEARAYRMEAAALEPLLKQAEAKCKTAFKGVKTSCRIPSPAGTVVMGQDIAGEACGNPVSATWKINTVSWVIAPYIGENRNIDPPWTSDCVLKGSTEETRRATILNGGAGAGRGWMCVYDPGDRVRKPTISIRSFRLPQCVPSGEQTITVDAVRTECDADRPPPRPEPPPAPDLPVG